MFEKINFLTVNEISIIWERELGIDANLIRRELRIALYKLEIDYPLIDDIKIVPKEAELPSPEVLIDRGFIEKFCDKEGWKLPDFWFRGLPTGPSFPGRPSVMAAIVQELDSQHEAGALAETLAEQSRQLAEWARKRFPGKQTPKPKSVENGIRTRYHILKKQS